MEFEIDRVPSHSQTRPLRRENLSDAVVRYVSAPRLPRPPFGVIGVCAYIAGFSLPFTWDAPLTVLALCTLLTIGRDCRNASHAGVPLVVPLLMFLAVTGLSTFASADVVRSMRLSTPLLPAVLVFVLITEHVHAPLHLRWLYTTFSSVALWLALAVLWGAWRMGSATAHRHVSEMGSPVLVEANDITFLATIAPMSLAVVSHTPRSGVGILAALSILLSICAIAVLQSRSAMLTMVVSLVCAGILMGPRYRLASGLVCGLTVVAVTVLLDSVLGFPLLAKFAGDWTGSGRMSLWHAAWEMFRDAPFLGCGPHTFVLFYESYLEDLGLPNPPRTIPWAHNLYLETLAEQGLAGLFVVALLLERGVSAAWRTQHSAVRQTRIFGAAVLAGLVSFAFAGVVELTFLRKWVVVGLFSLLALAAHLSSSTNNGTQV